jgi:hypothetical protein
VSRGVERLLPEIRNQRLTVPEVPCGVASAVDARQRATRDEVSCMIWLKRLVSLPVYTLDAEPFYTHTPIKSDKTIFSETRCARLCYRILRSADIIK